MSKEFINFQFASCRSHPNADFCALERTQIRECWLHLCLVDLSLQLCYLQCFYLLYLDRSLPNMDKTGRSKKFSGAKKLEHLIKYQEMLKVDKEFNPGKVHFTNSPQCEANLVNFFGDVHTEVFALRVSPDHKKVVAGCSNGEAKLYDLIEGQVLSINNTSRKADYPCNAVQWKPKSAQDFLACNCDGSIKWYNSRSGKSYGHYQHKSKAYLSCDYQLQQQWCALGTDKNTIEIFDNETMKPITQYEAGGPSHLASNHHTNRVFSVTCLPEDDNLFFSGGWDSTVQVWDVRVYRGSVRKINGPLVSADSLDIKGDVLLAGNYNNNDIAQLYDFGSGRLIQTLDIGQPHNSKSYCFAASYAQHSQHNLIAMGLAGSNCVKLLLNHNLVCTVQLQAAPLCLDFYRFNNKDFLVVGGLQGTIYAIKLKFRV